MRIRSNIFIWVFFATVVPLSGLILGATYYSENAYREDVSKDVLTSLSGTVAEIERHLQRDRELVMGISRAPAVQAYLPALSEISRQSSHPENRALRARLDYFFEGFQTLFSGVFYLRVLDYNGNTLVKVSHNGRSASSYDSVAGVSYAEAEINDPAFVNTLASMPVNDVSFTILPHHAAYETRTVPSALLDYVVPLEYEGNRVGAIAVTLVGSQLDRIMDRAIRLYDAHLFIAENNPEDLARHGQILYEKESNQHFALFKSQPLFVSDKFDSKLLDRVISDAQGVIDDDKRHTYFMEINPYPNRLVNWVLAAKIDEQVIAAPFTRIRTGIFLFAAIALIFSLLLMDVGARKIALPVCRLAGRLKEYANGNLDQRADTNQPIAEIQALASAFNYMADKLQLAQDERDKAQNMALQNNKLASIGQMAAGIGHEINNPLNNILSYTKLIQRSVDKSIQGCDVQTQESVSSDLKALRDEALRATDIVKGILNFGRQVPPHYQSFDVNEWLENTLVLVNQMAKSKHISLLLDNDYMEQLEGDKGQLQQALVNILLNAIQASPESSQIEINSQKTGTQLVIKVIDQGNGISKENIDRIFDPFFTTKSEGEGSGLGLSISLGIIERHNGTLDIRNNEDRGVTVTVILPLKVFEG